MKMKKMTKFWIGLTLMFSLITGASILIGTNKIGQVFRLHKWHAMQEVSTYLQEMNIESKGYTCTNQDTDGDGYVSCSVELLTQDGNVCPEARELDCSKWTLIGTSGCKAKNKLEMIQR